jgi:hypothetical protein
MEDEEKLEEVGEMLRKMEVLASEAMKAGASPMNIYGYALEHMICRLVMALKLDNRPPEGVADAIAMATYHGSSAGHRAFQEHKGGEEHDPRKDLSLAIHSAIRVAVEAGYSEENAAANAVSSAAWFSANAACDEGLGHEETREALLSAVDHGMSLASEQFRLRSKPLDIHDQKEI